MNYCNKEVDNFLKGNIEFLDKEIFSEKELEKISEKINKLNNRSDFIEKLILSIPKFGKYYDWNVGSIIRHFESSLVVSILKSIDDWRLFYDSIGLAWVLGEYGNRYPLLIQFLYDILQKTNNSEAWWRSAYSLEKLGMEDAVSLLKRSLKSSQLNNLNYYLNNINDKKSIISILILSNTDNIEKEIYPHIKKTFLDSDDSHSIINCCWLIGRLKLIDEDILKKLINLINFDDYEIKYYTLFALQNNSPESLIYILFNIIDDPDPLIRKMVIRSLVTSGNDICLNILKKRLEKETDGIVVSEITKAIYSFKNPHSYSKLLIELKSCKNENGLIIDESDKWYQDPTIYHIFSENEDPENICFDLVMSEMGNKKIINPIDLATGTGRMLWQIMNKTIYDGTLFGVDLSLKMCEFLEKKIKRERMYTNDVKIINSSIKELSSKVLEKSNFIISSFGFPSRIFCEDLIIDELRTVYDLLSDDGKFFTIGWDETFNDELNEMWFNYIPDDILADNFEDWRRKRVALIKTPRNANLTWIKKGILVPLQFNSLKESAQVMGYLFGRDATKQIVKTGKLEWNMSMGITCNTKKEIFKILEKYERN